MNELYELPEGWEWKKLNNISKKIFAGGDKPEKVSETITDKLKIPIYANAAKNNGLYGYTDVYKVEDECITISARGTIGFTVVRNEKFLPIVRLIVIIPNDDILSQILKYYLDYKLVENTGSSIPQLTVPTVKKLMFPLPPLQEQKRIVAKLDALFEKIDRAIALHQKNIDEVDAFMGSVLNDVFGELEGRYGLTVLSTVVKINSGIALPKIFKNQEYSNGEFEFFKVAQMNNDQRIMKGANLNFTLAQSEKFKIKLFPKGSILIPKRGGAILTNKKRIMLKEAAYDSNIMGLKADNTILDDEYLFAFLISIDLSNYIDTTTIPQVNNKHISMMNLPIPPLKIQHKTVTYLDKISLHVKRVKELQKEKMEHLKALKASILDQAFRGQL